MTEEELPPVAARPCNECPWVRTSRPGHLGPMGAGEWVELAHTDEGIACHKTIKESGYWEGSRQCAGAAQFRTNVFKSPRDPQIATAKKRDTDTVFAWNNEFIEHHEGSREP